MPPRKPHPPGASEDPEFRAWLAVLRAEAEKERGIPTALFDRVFAEVSPILRVVELDRRQPEFALSFARYYGQRITTNRIEKGRALLAEHKELLAEVEREHGLPPEIIVAFWGMETNYGSYLGKFDTVAALATLAYDERRSDFFRSELLDLLVLFHEGALEPQALRGSWAGALGHMQFLPSNYLRWAVDGDGDERRDLFGSVPDAFHSAGAFLNGLGWRADEPWGEEVLLPEGFEAFDQASVRAPPENRISRLRWHSLGLLRRDGSPLPADMLRAALVLPAGAEGPAFLTYTNYNRILNWNRSTSYALAVGQLSEILGGVPGLVRAPKESDALIRLTEIERLQEVLAGEGYYRGEIDGIHGPASRAAVAAWQRDNGRAGDGHLSRPLLDAVFPQAAE